MSFLKPSSLEAQEIDSFVLTMTSSGGEPPLKLLALDGGGIRGLSELLIIKEVMHRLMVEENTKRKEDGQAPLSSLPKPCDYFDLIGGTSTGGIIALMLGRLRMDVDKAIKCYDDLAKDVFSDPKRWGGDGKFKATKLEEAIKSVVKDVTGDSELPLLEGNEAGVCRTFVCTKNAHNANIPVLFRTYQSRETHVDCKIWEAARATSAAPTFFKRIEIGREQPFIDGGLGHNNPSRVVLEEANALFGTRQIGCLVSIGTGQADIISIKKPGLFQQIIPTDVIDALKAIALDCEATHEEMLGRFTNSPNTYFRLNVEKGMQGIQLSEWEKLSNVEAHTTQYMKKKEVIEKLALLVNVIRVPRAQLTIEQLISPRPPLAVESIQHIKERKLCPLPVRSFTGRKDILDKMRRYFDSDGKFQSVFVLYGLGGSGKSQLAFKFLRESQDTKHFSDIFYIDATSEQTLQADLKAITPGNVEQSVGASLRWLASQHDRNWLLLFDNADDVKLNLRKFFPSCESGNILVTTRNPELRIHAAGKDAVARVAGMNCEDAKCLLLQLSREEQSDENKKLAELIVEELHYFALAVSQAGAFIHCRSSLSEYRELYQHERDNLLQNKEVQGEDQYGLAVYATWRLSYDKLNQSAQTFLQICSILHHEGISEQIFEKAALSDLQLEDSELQNEVTQLLNQLGKQDSHWNSWVFRKIVRQLASYSLIECDRQNRTYSIHPLVQHWSGITMEKDRYLMQKCILSIIGLSISWRFDDSDYKYRRTLLQHINNSIASIKLEEISLSVASHIALVYFEQGHWNDAEGLDMVVMEKRKQLLGDDHPQTLASMANLASTYRNQGRWNDAEVLEVVAMEKRKRVLGDDHPDTLTIMANLATTYSDQGCWKDAEALEVVVMEKSKHVLGDDHPDTLTIMGNLAATYRKQGHWNDAEVLEVEVMEKSKQLLGDDHPQTLTSMANLASTYRNQGRWNDAEVLEVEVMEKSKQLLGDDHPQTLTSMANLAATYGNQGHWNDAEALEVMVMEKRKRVLGDDHPDTLMIMANLARTYSDQGRWNDAEALDMVVMEKRKQLLGDDHPDTLMSMGNLAATYSNQGRWNDAEALEVVVMEKRKQLLGDDHPQTLTSMANLARMYSDQGRWNDAEALEVVVMEKRKQVLGDDHPDTLMIMANLARTYSDQGRWNDAEALEVVVMEKRKQLLGHNHPDTLTSMAHLATTYSDQGRWNDAEALEVVAMEKTKRVLGDDHPDTLTIMANLACTCSDQGRWNDAEALEVVVLEKRRRVLGNDHPATLTIMANLARTYSDQGRWNDAEALEVVVLEKRKRVLGDDHPATLRSVANLADIYREQGRLNDAEALQLR
ncbi:hypothetical protein BDZ97DRAFT_1208591 [Flammula alnicola]|nr:hypothetical protein BDZ97DRAFT_1208591 [Flammula alnicola]